MALRDWFGRDKAPSSDRALATTFRRALLAVLEGDYDEAERLVTEAVKADSEDLEPYRALARLYRIRGEVGRAIRIHQNLLLRRDVPAGVRNGVLAELADDFRAGGFLKRAIASYREVLEYEPRNVPALRSLCELLDEAGEHREALAVAKRLERASRKRDPEAEARLLVRAARADHGQGHHDAARKAVKRALRRDPDNADARILLGELEAERGRNKAALASWRVVAEKGGPRAAEVHPKVEAAFASLGRARDYESFCRAILEGRPEDAPARRALASRLAARGETDPALLELRRVLDNHPDDVDARVALGRLLLDSGRDADALKQYRELLESMDGARRAIAWEEE